MPSSVSGRQTLQAWNPLGSFMSAWRTRSASMGRLEVKPLGQLPVWISAVLEASMGRSTTKRVDGRLLDSRRAAAGLATGGSWGPLGR